MKKGDMSMAVVIGAAIALLILVLLSVMLFNTFNNAREGTMCESLNEYAICISEDYSCSDENEEGRIYAPHSADCPAGLKCCIPIGG